MESRAHAATGSCEHCQWSAAHELPKKVSQSARAHTAHTGHKTTVHVTNTLHYTQRSSS